MILKQTWKRWFFNTDILGTFCYACNTTFFGNFIVPSIFNNFSVTKTLLCILYSTTFCRRSLHMMKNTLTLLPPSKPFWYTSALKETFKKNINWTLPEWTCDYKLTHNWHWFALRYLHQMLRFVDTCPLPVVSPVITLNAP